MTPDELTIALNRIGISNTDFATIAGVTPRQVNSWLRGVHAVPRSVSIILAAIDNGLLGLDWIVGFVEREMRKENRNAKK